MRVLPLFFFIILASFQVKSQVLTNSSPWFDGSIRLNNNQILTGEMYINFDHNVLVMRRENLMKAYSAYMIHSFSFYDRQMELERIFQTCRLQGVSKNPGDYFLEVVALGEITMYRRERIVGIPFQMNPYLFSRNSQTLALNDNFTYYLEHQDKMIKIKNFKRQIRVIAADYYNEIEVFIRKRHLNLTQARDQLKVVCYYNSLKNNSQLVADLK
jgi:hypothetical protein